MRDSQRVESIFRFDLMAVGHFATKRRKPVTAL